MKHKFYSTCIFLILILLTISLFACNNDTNDNNTCNITFVVIDNGNKVQSYSTKIEHGKTIDKSTFINLLDTPSDSVGGTQYTGPFWDEECIHKHNDDLPIKYDIVLYVKETNPSIPLVCFVLNDKTYTIALDNENSSCDVYDFIFTAYGKKSNAVDFEFYSDENHTQKITLVGDSYKQCSLNIFNRYTVYVKKISE